MASPNLIDQIRVFFTRYSLRQKMALAGTGALVLALLWVLVFFMNRVEYQTLYADLDPQEAQGLVQKLTDLKVPYELSTDGRTIKVASDKVAEVRIQLASEGLPESGRVGFEIFDRTNFGLTNFQEQVNYQRALEGELARSIMTLSEVDAARVHLVLAKDSLFETADSQTKASVILKLKNGRTLSASAAQGIVNVVASSVKGLTPEKVVLIDYKGKILSRNDSDSPLTTQQLDTRQKIETELSSKIVQILEPAVGTGKVRPQVSVALNFQQVEETVEQYDPQGSVVRSSQKQEEHQPTPANERGVGGIPGARPTPSIPTANAPAPNAQPAAAVPTDSNAASKNLLKENETINYEVSKAVRHIVNPTGKVEKLSIAVIIDNHTKVTTGADGKQQTSTEPRTPEEMKKYRDLVTAAIGLNTERGDQLTLENISFEGDLAEFVEQPTFMDKQGPMIMTALRYTIIPVVFILLYLFFLRPVQKTVFSNWATLSAGSPRMVPRLPGDVQTPMTVRQLEAQLRGESPVKDDYAGTPEREFLPLPSPSKMDMIRKRVVEHAGQDPETVARLVRIWLNDERNK